MVNVPWCHECDNPDGLCKCSLTPLHMAEVALKVFVARLSGIPQPIYAYDTYPKTRYVIRDTSRYEMYLKALPSPTEGHRAVWTPHLKEAVLFQETVPMALLEALGTPMKVRIILEEKIEIVK